MTMDFGKVVVQEHVYTKTFSKMENSIVHTKAVKMRIVVIQLLQLTVYI